MEVIKVIPKRYGSGTAYVPHSPVLINFIKAKYKRSVSTIFEGIHYFRLPLEEYEANKEQMEYLAGEPFDKERFVDLIIIYEQGVEYYLQDDRK